MAECASVCEHAHLPLQSGSTRILKAMRRTTPRALPSPRRPSCAARSRTWRSRPTSSSASPARRRASSWRPSRPSRRSATTVLSPSSTRRDRGRRPPTMRDQVPDEVKRERIERLIDVVQGVAAARNRNRVGGVEEVLVEGPSRTDAAILRGRTRRNTTVNFTGSAQPRRAGRASASRARARRRWRRAARGRCRLTSSRSSGPPRPARAPSRRSWPAGSPPSWSPRTPCSSIAGCRS